MLVLTLNYRGLDRLAKKIALWRLIDNRRPDVIFLQESMSEGGGIVNEL